MSGYVYGQSSGALVPQGQGGYVYGQSSASQESTAMIQQELKGGALSVKENKEMFLATKEATEGLAAELIVGMKQGSVMMKQFIVSVQKANDKYADFTFQLMERVSRTGELTQQDVGISQFFGDCADGIRKRYEQSMRLQIELNGLQIRGQAENCKQVVDTIAHAQMKRLDVLSSQIDLLHKQDKHELSMAMKEQEMVLDREKAEMEKMIAITKNEAELSRQRAEELRTSEEHQQKLEHNSERHKHEMKMEESESKRKDRIADYAHEEAIESTAATERTARHQSDNQKDVEEARIAADERARAAEAAASASKCSIQ